MKKIVQIALALWGIFILTGCHAITKSNLPKRATIVDPETGMVYKAEKASPWMSRPVLVNSTPQGAAVYLNEVLVGHTPVTVFVSPRSGGILTLTYPGYITRKVVLQAAVWGKSGGMATGGNIASTFISPPVGATATVVDRWVLGADKDFELPEIVLSPAPQQPVVAQHYSQQPPPEPESWRPRWPVAPSPFAAPQMQQQPLNKCCNPAKSIEELEAEHEARIRRR